MILLSKLHSNTALAYVQYTPVVWVLVGFGQKMHILSLILTLIY